MFVTKVNELEQDIHNELISLIEKKADKFYGINVYQCDVYFGDERIIILQKNNIFRTRFTSFDFGFDVLGIKQMAKLVDYLNSIETEKYSKLVSFFGSEKLMKERLEACTGVDLTTLTKDEIVELHNSISNLI